ncbi:hypothetical protein CJU90_4771 [Yarrowia sp. C11]|nr:hypothetical protein CJU90_4771 [Yarrowia sp. C11]
MSEVAELRMEVEHELELLRTEVEDLKSQLSQASKSQNKQNQNKSDISKENITAAGVLAILLWLGSICPGVYFSLKFSEDVHSGIGLTLANLFVPMLILVVTTGLPLMDRDRLTLEVVMLLGYGSIIVCEMTQSLWSPLVQALMASASIFLRRVHRNEIHRRKQGLSVSVDLVEQGSRA